MTDRPAVDDWPFADPPDLAVITLRGIVEDGDPVLLVSHDEDDGGWQFLAGGNPRVEDARIVSLHYMLDHDDTLREVADLPRGWQAWRAVPGGPWQRAKQS